MLNKSNHSRVGRILALLAGGALVLQAGGCNLAMTQSAFEYGLNNFIDGAFTGFILNLPEILLQ